VRADGLGRVSVTLQLTERGSNTIRLRGTGTDCQSPRVLGVKVNVRSAAASGAQGPRNADDALADTGTDFTPLWAGLGLLVAGAGLVSAARTRRRVTV
jgi:LPXTG-motif cell wall-anchored protein